MRTTLRRVAALAAPALLVSGLSLVATPAAEAAPPYDASPLSNAAGWLTGQLNAGNLLSIRFGNASFDDYGLSADFALSLDEVGGHDATVTAISDAVEAHVNDYVGDDGAGESYAGPVAKAAVLARAAGADPTSYGGENLVTRLEARVHTAADPIQGRIEDTTMFGPPDDFANVIGQSFAAHALDDANSPLTGSVTDFLLKQQCAAGFFRLDFTASKVAADQTCDGAGSATPDTDVTALAVLNLESQAGTPAVDAAVAKAVAWLQQTQKADGSFGGGGPTAAPNANSTGVAGWALGERGATADAEQAAIWLRQHQLARAGGCTTYAVADRGAIAYDDAGRTAAAATPLTIATRDQYVRATAQALPALRWAPLGATTVPVTKPAKGEFRHAGTSVTIPVAGANPGDVICISLRGGEPLTALVADAAGAGSATVTLPAGNAERTYNVIDSGGQVSLHVVDVLDKATLKLKAARKVKRGAKVVVKISRLAQGEKFKVLVDGKRKAKGVGTGKKLTVRLKAGPLGRHKVTVVGAFPDRTGKVRYVVTR